MFRGTPCKVLTKLPITDNQNKYISFLELFLTGKRTFAMSCEIGSQNEANRLKLAVIFRNFDSFRQGSQKVRPFQSHNSLAKRNNSQLTNH